METDISSAASHLHGILCETRLELSVAETDCHAARLVTRRYGDDMGASVILAGYLGVMHLRKNWLAF